MAYTKEEIEQFQKKDKRISMQGLVQVLLATGANIHEVKENVALAKKYSDEIWRIVDGDTLILPTPTADQKKVLDAIDSKVNIADRKELVIRVLQYSTEVAGLSNPTYPTSMGSVDKIVEWIKDQ
jgi:hypothetical protein